MNDDLSPSAWSKSLELEAPYAEYEIILLVLLWHDNDCSYLIHEIDDGVQVWFNYHEKPIVMYIFKSEGEYLFHIAGVNGSYQLGFSTKAAVSDICLYLVAVLSML